MKRKELLDKLNIVKSSLSSQDIIPVLTHFAFDKTKISAFNTGQAIVVEYETGLACCIPGDIIKLLHSYDSEEITIVTKEDKVAVKSGRSHASLNTLPLESFPFPDLKSALASDIQYVIPADFVKAIKHCGISMNANPGKRNQHGVTIISTPAKTTVYSTDNQRISSYTLDKPCEGGGFTIILPKPFCDVLVSLADSFNGGKIYVGKESVVMEFLTDGKPSGTLIYSKFVDVENFLPFETIISSVPLDKVEFKPIPDALIDCVNRHLSLATSSKDHEINISVEEATLHISSASNLGQFIDEIEFDSGLSGVSCIMKTAMMSQAFNFDAKMAFVKFTGTVVLAISTNNFLHILSSIKNRS